MWSTFLSNALNLSKRVLFALHLYSYGPVIVVFKVGDKRTAPGKEHLGLKDGMPICWWGGSTDWYPQISDHMKKTFCIIEFDGSMEHVLPAAMQANQGLGPETPVSDPVTYRPRTKLINFGQLALLTTNPDLENDLRSNKIVTVINGHKLSKSTFLNSDSLNPPAFDSHAVSTGSYTVGTAGDYATWALAVADMANLTGHLTFTQISPVTETATSNATELLGGFTLTYTSDMPHNGDPTGGHLINDGTIGATHLFVLGIEGPGAAEIKNLYFKKTANRTDLYSFIVTVGIATAFTSNFHDILMDGAGYSGSGFYAVDATLAHNVYNCVIWGFSIVSNFGIKFYYAQAGDRVENCTVYNCDIGCYTGNHIMTVENCICASNNTDFSHTAVGTIGNNNASEDATAADASWASGSNNQINITVANEFENTTDTDSDFLKLKSAGICHDGGKAPSIAGNDHGIRNNSRPHNVVDYSIGADEYASSVFQDMYRKYW